VFLDASNVTNISNLKLASGATVTAILDEDTLSSDSATSLATQQSIKAYVDAVPQELNFQGDSGGALIIDLDSETLTVAGGTGIDTSGSGNTLTVAIDSTVATKSYVSTQVDLVNDTTPQLGGDLSTNSNNILFADNDVASFGASGDLQIYHDSSNSYISERGTGDLYVGANGNIEFFKHLSTDRMAKFITDGAVELYHANSKKIETTSSGVSVTGSLDVTDASTTRTNLGLGTAALTNTGISSGNTLVADSTVADDDFLRINGTSVEGRSASEVLNDIGATTLTEASDEATALAIALG
jgi:hypothetical protein